jgi:hypothetical protein
MSFAPEDEDSIGMSFIARPVVAGIATAGLLAVFPSGAGASVSNYARQMATGAGSILVSDYVAGMLFPGMSASVLSPVLSGAIYAGAQRAMGSDVRLISNFVSGASIDVASQWLLNPVGRMLGF